MKKSIALLIIFLCMALVGCSKETDKENEENKAADLSAAVASQQMKTRFTFQSLGFKKQDQDIVAKGEVKAARSPFYYRVEQSDGKVLVQEHSIKVPQLNTFQPFTLKIAQKALASNDVVLLVLYGKQGDKPMDENYIPIDQKELDK